MIYECTLANANGREVIAYYKAESHEAFRIADAVAAWRREPLAMLAMCQPSEGEATPAAWLITIPGTPITEAEESALNARRDAFVQGINDMRQSCARSRAEAEASEARMIAAADRAMVADMERDGLL